MVKDLPYPYTSKAQFERSLDTPVGIEWNTRVGFQRATLPRVVKKVYHQCSLLLPALILIPQSADGYCYFASGEITIDIVIHAYLISLIRQVSSERVALYSICSSMFSRKMVFIPLVLHLKEDFTFKQFRFLYYMQYVHELYSTDRTTILYTCTSD